MAVAVIWVIVGLYVVWLVVWSVLFRSPLKSRASKIRDLTFLILYRSINWVRVHILRRKSWDEDLTDAQRNISIMTGFLDTYDIRYVVRPSDDGSVAYMVHRDDADKLANAIGDLEAQLGPFTVVDHGASRNA